jgi:hypothetical protein
MEPPRPATGADSTGDKLATADVSQKCDFRGAVFIHEKPRGRA